MRAKARARARVRTRNLARCRGNVVRCFGDFRLDDDAVVIVGEFVGSGSWAQRRPGHQIHRYQLTGSFR